MKEKWFEKTAPQRESNSFPKSLFMVLMHVRVYNDFAKQYCITCFCKQWQRIQIKFWESFRQSIVFPYLTFCKFQFMMLSFCFAFNYLTYHCTTNTTIVYIIELTFIEHLLYGWYCFKSTISFNPHNYEVDISIIISDKNTEA